jgi:hypothetical protein
MKENYLHFVKGLEEYRNILGKLKEYKDYIKKEEKTLIKQKILEELEK